MPGTYARSAPGIPDAFGVPAYGSAIRKWCRNGAVPKWCRALIYDVVVPEAGFEPGPPYGDELAESAKIIQGHFWDWVGEARE